MRVKLRRKEVKTEAFSERKVPEKKIVRKGTAVVLTVSVMATGGVYWRYRSGRGRLH